MATATRLAAISGGQRDVFDEMFWAGVTLRSSEGHPLRGSIGVAYQPFKDLKELRDIEEVEKEYVNKADPTRPDLGAPLGRRCAVAVKQYFRFCEDEANTHFFIKKGGVALWLVRKTSGYVYEPRDDVLHWACHRVHFEFVRVATKEEGERRTGVNARSLYWMECSTPMSLLPAGEVTKPGVGFLLTEVDEPEPKPTPPSESKESMLTQGKVVRKKKMEAPTGTKTLEEVMGVVAPVPVSTPASGGAGAGAGAGATAPAAATTDAPPKKKRAPAKKKAVAPAPAPAATITGQTTLPEYTKPTVTLAPALLEAKESPLSVEHVEVVKVKLFEHDGVTYYREPVKNKLYKRLANGSIGSYHGRWNPRTKMIDTTIPDSDEDREDSASTF